ncbi:MAG: hypothetical protein V4750_05535 [Pseudomonadota bacterium]
MFEYVVASLGRATLITKEDAGNATAADGGGLQAPDYFVALKDGQRFLVEVKNCRLKSFQSTVTLNREYLGRLRRYAELKGNPLLLAVYWSNLRQWTIGKVDDLVNANGSIGVTFVDAMHNNMASLFGDRALMAKPPLVCRLWADPSKPRTLSEDGEAALTIARVSFFAEGQTVVDERERELALYLMFHSSWGERRCEASLADGLLDYVEFEFGPEEGAETPDQAMQSLGTLAGMVANYYNWLTVSGQHEIVRLTPGLQPSQMGSGLDDAFSGSVLKLWILAIEPSGKALLRVT